MRFSCLTEYIFNICPFLPVSVTNTQQTSQKDQRKHKCSNNPVCFVSSSDHFVSHIKMNQN